MSASRRQRAVCGAGVQDHERPVRRQPDVLPHLLGQAEAGCDRLNTVKDKKERIGRMLQMHSNRPRRDQGSPRRRHIAARLAQGCREPPAIRCAIRKQPVILERMEFRSRLLRSRSSRRPRPTRKRWVALQRLAQEDPSFRVSTDEESGQTIIKGMGELHLDIIVDRMKREFKVEANVGASRRWPTARRSPSRSDIVTTPTRSRPVVPVSSRA